MILGMNKKTASLYRKVRSLVFIGILIIGIPSLLLLYNNMNMQMFTNSVETNQEWVTQQTDDFRDVVDNLILMSSWISENEDILANMNMGDTDVSLIRRLLDNQEKTGTYLMGSRLSKYINKIVVFSVDPERRKNSDAAGRFYINPNLKNGSLEDVGIICSRDAFRVFDRSMGQNVIVYPSYSINYPQEMVIASLARGRDGTTYIYVEMATTVLDHTFEGHVGKDLYLVGEGGWSYPESVPATFRTSRYQEFTIPLESTGLEVRYYINRSILSFLSARSIVSFVIIFLSAIILSYFVSHVITGHITKPVSKLVNHIRYLTATNDYGYVDSSIEETGDELSRIGHSINSMSRSIKVLLDRNEKLFEEKKDTEMRLLQMQVNPHFLYNTLESIHWMAEVQKSEGIASMARGLSNLLKNISKNTDDHIPLYEELELLHEYEEIQQVRYMGLFEVIDRIPEELKHYHIIKFTLQPLVENAIFHGIEPSGRDGKIMLLGHKDDRYLYIDLIDNGIGMTKEEMEDMFNRNSRTRGLTGVGLRNVDERLKLTYGEECGLTYYSQKNVFTRVSIKLLLEED